VQEFIFVYISTAGYKKVKWCPLKTTSKMS